MEEKICGIENIIQELNVPKSQYNSFGKYNYRNCEDILEAVKPLLKKHTCFLSISDELLYIGNRYYVKATATISDSSGLEVSATGFAREEEDKKGMDGSQITGASSSYARKYALNALFLIDDQKDSDSTNKVEKTQKINTTEKPWYNNFWKDKDLMVDKIASGEKTAEQIIASLEEKYMLSKSTKESILALQK